MRSPPPVLAAVFAPVLAPVFAAGLAAGIAGTLALVSPSARADPGARPVVTILGDSITAGYGLPAADALPAALQRDLDAMGVPAVVRGAGVSGDTTASGLARVGFSVAPDTALCVVELGANDYLQSLPPGETKRNLSGIVAALKARHIRVLLMGGTVPGRGAGDYAAAFDAIFPDVARAQHVALEPDFLDGIESDPALKQADNLHPNAAGVQRMARKLAAAVATALKTPQG